MSSEAPSDAPRVEFNRLPEVSRRTGLSKSTIYRLEARGDFVRRVKLGDRITAYRADEITAWIEARTAQGRGAA